MAGRPLRRGPDDIAKSTAHRNGEVEQSQHQWAPAFGEKVGDDGRRNRRVRGLTHTDRRTIHQQYPEKLGRKRQ